MTDLSRLEHVCRQATERFGAVLATHCRTGLAPAVHHRFLTVERDLMRDARRYFMSAAAHPDLRDRRLRTTLLTFAHDDTTHIARAANLLPAPGRPSAAMPADVALWRSFFRPDAIARPLIRVGAACALEILADPDRPERQRRGAARPSRSAAAPAPADTRPPSRERLLDALSNEPLTPTQCDDLVGGALRGTMLFLRIADWALQPVSSEARQSTASRWPDADLVAQPEPDGASHATPAGTMPEPG